MAHNLSRHEPKKYSIFFFIIVGSAMPVQLRQYSWVKMGEGAIRRALRSKRPETCSAAIRSIYKSYNGLLYTPSCQAQSPGFDSVCIVHLTGYKRSCHNDCNRRTLVHQRHRTESEICHLLVVWHGRSGGHHGGYWWRHQINRKRLVDG